VPTAVSDSTVTTNQGQQSSDPKGKKDYSTAILERKKPPTTTTQSSLCTRISWSSSSSPTAPRSSPSPKEARSVHGPRPSSAVRPIRGRTRTRGTISASLEATPPRPPATRSSPPRLRVGGLPSSRALRGASARGETPPRSRPPSAVGTSNPSAHLPD